MKLAGGSDVSSGKSVCSAGASISLRSILMHFRRLVADALIMARHCARHCARSATVASFLTALRNKVANRARTLLRRLRKKSSTLHNGGMGGERARHGVIGRGRERRDGLNAHPQSL